MNELYSISYLKKYINNELPKEEEEVIELQMQEDELLSELILGLQIAKIEGRSIDLESLPTEIPSHIFETNSVPEKTLVPYLEHSPSIIKKLWPLAALAAMISIGVFIVRSQNPSEQQLANQYFEHYTDQISVRGDGSNLTKAMKLYNQKEYAKATEVLQTLCNDNEETACFYLGMSQYLKKQNDVEASYKALKKVSKSSTFYPIAQFYGALAALSNNQIAEARILLEQIDENKSYRHKDASDLLKTLN